MKLGNSSSRVQISAAPLDQPEQAPSTGRHCPGQRSPTRIWIPKGPTGAPIGGPDIVVSGSDPDTFSSGGVCVAFASTLPHVGRCFGWIGTALYHPSIGKHWRFHSSNRSPIRSPHTGASHVKAVETKPRAASLNFSVPRPYPTLPPRVSLPFLKHHRLQSPGFFKNNTSEPISQCRNLSTPRKGEFQIITTIPTFVYIDRQPI